MKVDAKMVQAALGMLARFIPSEEYAKIASAINDLAEQARAIDRRLQRIEQTSAIVAGLVDRLNLLETIVRNGVDGAQGVYAERDGWMVQDRIAQALAPAKEGSLNDH